jgi:hypothetical protein
MAETIPAYTKDGETRQPLDQSEVNDLVWRGWQPVETGTTTKKSTAKSES